MLESVREAILENLAIVRACCASGLPEAARRDAGGAMKGAHEVRQVRESDVECDIDDRAVVLGQRPGGAPQPGPQQVLMRGDSDDVREQAQEVVRTQSRAAGAR